MATRPRSSIPAPARPTWRLHASSCRRGCRMKKRKLPPPRLRRRLRNEARSTAAEIIHLADLDVGVTQDVVGSRDVEEEIRQRQVKQEALPLQLQLADAPEIGIPSCSDRVCSQVQISVCA